MFRIAGSAAAALFALTAVGAALAQEPPVMTAVVNGATFEARLTPGVVASIFGMNLTAADEVTTCSVNGLPGHVLFADPAFPTQINVQLPVEAELGPAELVVTRGGVSSVSRIIILNRHAPAFFTTDSMSAGFFRHADFSLVTPENPAMPGETIIGFGLGWGPTDPVVPTGVPSPADPLALTVTQPGKEFKFYVGRVGIWQEAVVRFSGLAPGLFSFYQFNFDVPLTADGPQTVFGIMNGQVSNLVTLPVAGGG